MYSHIPVLVSVIAVGDHSAPKRVSRPAIDIFLNVYSPIYSPSTVIEFSLGSYVIVTLPVSLVVNVTLASPPSFPIQVTFEYGLVYLTTLNS